MREPRVLGLGFQFRARSARAGLGLLVALVALLAAAPAGAHQPWFNEAGSPDPAEPYRLPTPLTISQVVYGGFAAPERVDYYAFTAPAGFELTISLVVADAPACARFRPAFALIGPGLPALDAASAATPVPASVPRPDSGEGTIVVAGDEWGTLYEPYADVTFITGPELRQRLTGGDYLVAVFDPDGGTGTYGLTLGGDEVFGGDPDFATKFEPWRRCEPPSIPPATPTAL